MKDLALCMIVKGDEWEETKRCIDSVIGFVDKIFITTTQKNNHPTQDKVIWSHFDWVNDFSEARNFNFSQASEYKYVIWLDSDDVLQDADVLPDIISRMKLMKLDAIYCDYNYQINKESGEIEIVHPRERIVINDGSYTWKGALHETLISSREVRTKYIKDIVVNHYPNEKTHAENIYRNLEIMGKKYAQESKEVLEGNRKEIDPRTEYYLGRILFDTHTQQGFIRASQLFQDYLQHSGWDEERAQAWHYLSRIFMEQQLYDDAINCCLSAKRESNKYPTWDIMLANIYCAKQDYESAEIAITQALSIPQPKTALIVVPIDDKINTLRALFLISFHKNDLHKAIKYAQAMYQLKKNKENKQRIKTVEELITIGEWMKSSTSMIEELGHDFKRIEGLLSSLPDKVQKTVFVQQLKNDFLPPKTWSKKSIVYFVASDFENWSPKSLEKGIGGSEEAVIYLSQEFVKLGYEVTVYAKVGGEEGVYDGVQYLNYQKFNPHDHFNILIGWRNPSLFKYNSFSANLTLLDLHDVPQPNDYTQEIIDRVDYIMVKSKYHRSLLPKVPERKFVIVGNGIDTSTLKKYKPKNRRYKIFWGSSYDRGLENLLKMWPEIRRTEPLAELHVCYGWNLFDKVYEHIPQMKKWRKQMEQMMTLEGVFHHGRVGKKELYEIASDCGVWAYPTEFQEIDCITGRYTQSLGLCPVVSDYGALQTTVRYGYKTPMKDEHLLKDKYLNTLLEVLLSKERQSSEREKMIAYSMKNYSWENVAKKWIDVFKSTFEQPKISVITPTIRTGFWNIMADNLSKQTYSDFEWIIVDDYEHDRSAIAKKYAEKYDLDIVYIRPGERSAKVKRKYGLSSANNVGWKASSGELCVWLQDFVLIEPNALQKLAKIHRHHPYSFIAPVDRYYSPKMKPILSNQEDWFSGNIDVVGEHLRDNQRIDKGWVRESDHIYDLELNFGAIPKQLLEDLNGFWEFYDDALGYDDTEIVYRGFQLGATLIVDETNVCSCIDHWEALRGTKENGQDREHNLNDPRFVWMMEKMKVGSLPIKRKQKLDDKIDLKYEIPTDTTQDGAVEWMKEHLDEIIGGWK